MLHASMLTNLSSLLFSPLTSWKATLSVYSEMVALSQSPRYLDLTSHCMKSSIIIYERLEREGGDGPEAQVIGQHLLQAEELRKRHHKVFIGHSNSPSIQNVSPKISILYSNRARCYRELKDFDKVQSAICRAIAMRREQSNLMIRT